MATVSHQDIRVTEKELNRLKRAQHAASGMNAYARFKAWLHYANLHNYQSQGLHFHYLSSSTQAYCTCGLIVDRGGPTQPVDTLSKEVLGKVAVLKLDEVQQYRGHIDLPSFGGAAVALVTSFVSSKEGQGYLWDAFCQECGDFVAKEDWENSLAFVKEHNERCFLRDD